MFLTSIMSGTLFLHLGLLLRAHRPQSPDTGNVRVGSPDPAKRCPREAEKRPNITGFQVALAKEGKPKEGPPEPEKLLVGKRVVVRFMDGTALTGTLASMHQYTFVLEVEGKALLIYKHGVKLIEEAP